MTHQAVSELLEELAAEPGVAGCAVVDATTGMAWYHAGKHPGLERLSEAAVEFWRVQLRLGEYFAELGRPRSAAFSFDGCMVALFPCRLDPPLVLVCMTTRTDMAWRTWGEHVARLKRLLAQPAAAVPTT